MLSIYTNLCKSLDLPVEGARVEFSVTECIHLVLRTAFTYNTSKYGV